MAGSKKCCAECFGDRHLRQQVFPFLGEETDKGLCDYCGSEEQLLLGPEQLGGTFEPVFDIYERDDEGETLGHWLKNDWAMFGHASTDAAHVKELLGDILDDGDVASQHFSPASGYESDTSERWESLRKELMHENRFFPDSGSDLLKRLEAHLEHLLLSSEELREIWYRARIQQGDTPYKPAQMFAPPKERATHGRANPAGIPYLYLASAANTAIAELRPHTGEMATVAEFGLGDGLRIVDLTAPRKCVSPFFVIGEDEDVGHLRADLGFLEKLGKELTRPVLPTAAAVDYTPSQYLCEFVKKCGYDGVRYASSVGGGVGVNLALFDPTTATVGAVEQHEVTRVSVEHEPRPG